MTPDQIKAALKCCAGGSNYGCNSCPYQPIGVLCNNRLLGDTIDLIEMYQKTPDRYADGLDDMCKAYQTIYYEMSHDDKIKYFNLEYSYEIMYKVEPARIVAVVAQYHADKANEKHDKMLEKLKKTVDEFGGMQNICEAIHELMEKESSSK